MTQKESMPEGNPLNNCRISYIMQKSSYRLYVN